MIESLVPLTAHEKQEAAVRLSGKRVLQHRSHVRRPLRYPAGPVLFIAAPLRQAGLAIAGLWQKTGPVKPSRETSPHDETTLTGGHR